MRYFKLNFSGKMNVKLLLLTLLAAVFTGPAMADDQYSDTARVISVSPQTERVNMPHQECRTEYQQQTYSNNANNSIAGAVIGGIAGGLLGNTIGKGNGRVVAAAVGAGVGALAGNSIANNQNSGGTRSVPVQICYQIDNWQAVNSGYLVTYEYNGRTYTTVANSHPGTYIDVNVIIEPRSRMAPQISYLEPIRYNQQGHHERDDYRSWGNRRDGDDRYGEQYRERRYY
ncbi:MAG: glycine zipper 2TM domain-containing protein [Methylotenera sp.]|nr:glycine zipper 2TM domain-containing protein [Methylotenera sp.]MSP99105.1 glycine zipper 2TM domain-containing protein [Methylotenera sp.]